MNQRTDDNKQVKQSTDIGLSESQKNFILSKATINSKIQN